MLPLLAALALLAGPSASDATAQNKHGVTSAEGTAISLAEAEQRALEQNRMLRVSEERLIAAEARADAAGAFLLPSVGVDAGYVTSDDPVAAFGTRLRQGSFRESDFALDALNHPNAVDDWSGGLALRWSPLDPSAWAGRSAARHASEAESRSVDRTRDATLLRARVLYLDALRARAAREAATATLEAAEATVARVSRRRDQGLLTDADLLQAEAALSEARAQQLLSLGAQRDAEGRLGLHLGFDPAERVTPSDLTLEEVTEDQAAGSPEERSDVAAARASARTAQAHAGAARAARLPTVAIEARLGTHAPGLADGREANVTLGIQVGVPLFTGGRTSAAIREADAQERAARLALEDRSALATLEREEAERAVEAGRAALDAARAADRAAEEAERLMRLRFDEGLITTSDLLDVQARTARLRAAAVEAESGLFEAFALRSFARGSTTPPFQPTDSSAPRLQRELP